MKVFKLIFYLVIVLSSYLISLFFNSYESFLVFLFLVLILCVDILVFIFPKGKFKIIIESEKTNYFKNETGKVVIKIKSNKFYPISKAIFNLNIKNNFYDGKSLKVEKSISAFFTEKTKVDIKIEQAGIFKFSVNEVLYSDMLGIFFKKEMVKEMYSIVVYPNEVEIGDINISISEGEDSIASNVYASDNGDVSGYKEFIDGDRKKDINWKLYSRTGSLYVKEFEKISVDEKVVLVDMNIKNIDKALDFLYSIYKKGYEFNVIWLPCGNEEFESAFIKDENSFKECIYRIFNSKVDYLNDVGLKKYKDIKGTKVLYLSEDMRLV